jgi:predicted membrane protein
LLNESCQKLENDLTEKVNLVTYSTLFIVIFGAILFYSPGNFINHVSEATIITFLVISMITQVFFIHKDVKATKERVCIDKTLGMHFAVSIILILESLFFLTAVLILPGIDSSISVPSAYLLAIVLTNILGWILGELFSSITSKQEEYPNVY